jgi:hypothetical protein
VQQSKGHLASSWSSRKPKESWAILEPCDCPARLVRTTVPSQEAQKALAFLIEPQLPLPLEDCTVIGLPIEQRAEDADYLVSYARRDSIEKVQEGDFLFPGSLAVAALPHLLSLIPSLVPTHASDGLWLISFPRSWTVACMVDGLIVGVRSMPRGDLVRLTMAQQELGPTAVHRSLGPCSLEGWEEVPAPDWMPRGSEWLGVAALAIRLRGRGGDLRPMTVARLLDQPPVRRTLWGVGLFLGLAGLAVWLGTHALIQDRLSEMAILSEQIPSEMVRLSKEITEASCPFSPEPPLPRCYQVLQWLSSVPGLGHDRGLSLERFRYQMPQYPTAGRERESYQAKVSIEIACKDAFRARKILDAVSQPNPKSPIDLKQPLDWSHHQGVYRLSFTLKQPGKSGERCE